MSDVELRDLVWTAFLAFVTAFVIVTTSGCGAAQKPAGCTEKDELAIDAWFQAELVKECMAFTPTKDPKKSCPRYEALEDEYKRRSEEWYVRCHP